LFEIPKPTSGGDLRGVKKLSRIGERMKNIEKFGYCGIECCACDRALDE